MMNGLPGIEALFREHKRLSSKLTKDEMKAMRQYLDDRLLSEQNEMLFQLSNLRTNYDADRQQMTDTIERLKKELEFKTELMDQYKTTDSNLATVHKHREERLEQKQSELTSELDRAQNEALQLRNEVNELKREVSTKKQHIIEQQREIEQLTEVQSKIRKAEDLISTNEHVKQDLLRLKIEIDAKEKEMQKLRHEISPLKEELRVMKNKFNESEEKNENLVQENKKLIKEIQAKNENVAIAKYHLDVEKRKVKDLERELDEYRNCVPTDQRATSSNAETSRVRIEVLRIHQQHLESRVKILEEKVAMYRVQCRNVSQEITIVSDEITKLSTVRDRINVHGTTMIEKSLTEIFDSMNERKSALETVLDDLVRQIPGIISKDSSSVKADVTSVKKQAEIHKVSEIVLKATRLLQRIEACDKAKFFHSNLSQDKKHNISSPRTKLKSREQNLSLKLATRANKHEQIPQRIETLEKEDTIDAPDRMFETVKPKTPSNNLLSRPKQTNGPPVPTTWRRKQSFSMEFTPTLIDLTLSPVSTPSPKEKSKSSFFASSSTSSLCNGIHRKSFSEQGDR